MSYQPSFKEAYKIAIIGAAQSGKTSLMHKYIFDKLPAMYFSTRGAEFFDKTVSLRSQQFNGDINVKLSIWDTEALDKLVKNAEMFLGGTAIFIILIPANQEIDAKKKLIQSHLADVKPFIRDASEVKFMVVETKIDLVEKPEFRQLTHLELRSLDPNLNYHAAVSLISNGNTDMFHDELMKCIDSLINVNNNDELIMMRSTVPANNVDFLDGLRKVFSLSTTSSVSDANKPWYQYLMFWRTEPQSNIAPDTIRPKHADTIENIQAIDESYAASLLPQIKEFLIKGNLGRLSVRYEITFGGETYHDIDKDILVPEQVFKMLGKIDAFTMHMSAKQLVQSLYVDTQIIAKNSKFWRKDSTNIFYTVHFPEYIENLVAGTLVPKPQMSIN